MGLLFKKPKAGKSTLRRVRPPPATSSREVQAQANTVAVATPPILQEPKTSVALVTSNIFQEPNITEALATTTIFSDILPRIANTGDVYPRLSLSHCETGVLFYTLSVSKERVCFFLPSNFPFMAKNRSDISIEDVKAGEIYSAKGINQNFVGKCETLSGSRRNKYISRNTFVCNSPETYNEVVLSALLLGCRVRDFERRCATVSQMGDLELTMSPQGRQPEKLTLRTMTGQTFTVDVRTVKADEETVKWIVGCTPVVSLPTDVGQGCMLEIVSNIPKPSHVTTTLMNYYSYGSTTRKPIANWSLLDCIYGEPSHLSLRPVEIIDPTIHLKGDGVMKLNPQQAEAMARYNCSSCPGFVIEAPPGSGKTLTAAAMAVSYKGKGIQLFLSTANAPVLNMAQALAKLDIGLRSPIHLQSAESVGKTTEENHSPFSSEALAKNQENMRLFIERLESNDKENNVGDKDRRWKHEGVRKACGPILDEQHDIYFATVDTVLSRYFKNNLSGRVKSDYVKSQFEHEVKRVVIDEASQLTEAALNALVLCFPKAQIVLIGDTKQLSPFKYKSGDVISELASRSALEVVKDKRNLPVIKLREVYRASPSLIAHYSNVFYGGALLSMKPPSTKNPLKCFGERGGGSRCIFWKVENGISKTPYGSNSKFNQAEISHLKDIIIELRLVGYNEKSIMIISYYEAQRKDAERMLTDNGFNGYEVLTVDSAQGREKAIVIVLTTRSTISQEPNESFVNSPKRCNVAVSRHQEALIVLGHPSLVNAPNWTQVLSENYFFHVENNGTKH